MTYINMMLQTLPEIGFAHHFYAENYQQSYGLQDNSFEIVYIKSGKLQITLSQETFEAVPGSIFILCRELPIHFKVVDNSPHSHCSIQLRCSFSSYIFNHAAGKSEIHPGLLLPMVFPPSEKAEQVGRRMHSIIAKLQSSRSVNMQSCTLAVLGILADLDSICREQFSTTLPSDLLLATKLKELIDSHLDEDISLNQMSAIVGRSPNYLNTIFKQVNGIPVRQYINRKKAMLIAELMIHKNASFRTACENVGISDIAYGYRLFKKQMGATPQQYVAAVYHKNRTGI